MISKDDKLQELLDHWEMAWAKGTNISAEELCRDHPDLLAVVAKRALCRNTAATLKRRLARVLALLVEGGIVIVGMARLIDLCNKIDNAERARDDAIAATVANIRLNENVVEFVANDSARWARFHASGMRAMFANVAHHKPTIFRAGRLGGELLYERYVPPRRSGKRAGVVVRIAGELEPVRGKLVPLFAGDLTGFAANADRGIRKESRRHASPYPQVGFSCGKSW